MYSNIFILIKYTTQKFSLVFYFFILISFWSCTNTEFQNLNEGVKFINVFDENTNYINEKINLSTSYNENNKKICLYIKNDTKIFREIQMDKKCPSEI